MVCLSCPKEKSKCRVSNAVNKNSCKICREKGTDRKYTGETSSQAFRRSVEHVKDLLDQKENSHMQQNVTDTHPELKGNLQDPRASC